MGLYIIVEYVPMSRMSLYLQVLGKALQGLPRDRIFVTSKCGRYDEAEFDFSAARIRRSVRESLERLQLDYLDLIHCHDIEFVHLDQVGISESVGLRLNCECLMD